MKRFKLTFLLCAISAVTSSTACGGGSDDPAGPDQAPAAPSGLVATAMSPSRIDLSWTVSGSDADGFRIERAPGGTTTFAEIGTAEPEVTSFQSTGLTAATSYSYRIRAFNAAGSSAYSNTATTSTQVPGGALSVGGTPD